MATLTTYNIYGESVLVSGSTAINIYYFAKAFPKISHEWLWNDLNKIQKKAFIELKSLNLIDVKFKYCPIIKQKIVKFSKFN